MDFETAVKLALYQMIAETARVPTSAELAAHLECPQSEVENAFDALARKRLLVFELGSRSHLRMAPPFSGVETPFPVIIKGKTYFANCVWDAYGIAAALHADAVVNASDGHTGEALTMDVRNGAPVDHGFVAHFAVPAAKWWENIIHT